MQCCSRCPICGSRRRSSGGARWKLSLILAGGEIVRRHSHPDIEDLFVSVAGPIDVHAKAPAEVTRLNPGERLRIGSKRAHLVHNPTDGFVTFLNVQGIGPYDYVPVGDQVAPKFEAREL